MFTFGFFHGGAMLHPSEGQVSCDDHCPLCVGVIPHIHKSLIGKKGTPQAPWTN